MCDYVVMDDAATGILGELPKFEGWTKKVQSVSPDTALCQYVMKTPKHLLFVDSVLLQLENSFTVRNYL